MWPVWLFNSIFGTEFAKSVSFSLLTYFKLIRKKQYEEISKIN